MGRKSIKANKNIYQLAREAAGLTREKASDLIRYISPERIEKIESGKTPVHPDELPLLAKAYKRPDLLNSYCANECPIGKCKEIGELKNCDFSQVVLQILSTVSLLESQKNRLIEISADGEISDDEMKDFNYIRTQLKAISDQSEALRIWIEKMGYQENEL